MEIKLHVNVGATLQVKNARGEWDWIKPEVGAEVLLTEGEVQREFIQVAFGKLWDDYVGPQFKSVVVALIDEQVPELETTTETVDATETVVSEDEYY